MTAQTWTTLCTGLLSALGVCVTLLVNAHHDRQSDWWERAIWAIEQTHSTEASVQITGFHVLGELFNKLRSERDRKGFIFLTAKRLVSELGLDIEPDKDINFTAKEALAGDDNRTDDELKDASGKIQLNTEAKRAAARIVLEYLERSGDPAPQWLVAVAKTGHHTGALHREAIGRKS